MKFACFLISAVALSAQTLRPPAVPLITHDPYFSIWSMSDKLTDTNTKHWTGTEQPIAGLIRIDGANFRFMGARPRRVPALPQQSVSVTPTHTVYTFANKEIQLTVTFLTPALPHDLDILSRPVTYLTFNVTSADHAAHKVSILIDCDPVLAVNDESQQVIWTREQATPSLHVLSVGSKDQNLLNRSGDNVRRDWGYFHLATTTGSTSTSKNTISSFLESGPVPAADDLEMPAPARDAAHLAVVLNADVDSSAAQSRHILFSYTEPFSIDYLNERLKPYWRHNGVETQTMLEDAETQYQELETKSQKFDHDLINDLTQHFGADYAQLATLAYRQTLAAHGLAVGLHGEPLMFPKENFSNGCISTVDVIYPSGPFFLFFNPILLEAQLEPVLRYASLPRWKWPFAPHDLGTYPLADGQVYGGGERTEEDQMPVEESGNLLILIAALERELGNYHLAETYWPELTKWADYLRSKGLDPENQLSTDDFAGHLAHNANLSIKAIEGLAAYAQLAKGLGKASIASDFSSTAKDMAAKWQQMAREGDHYKLAFDKPGTWSQKYNLVWDKMLGFDLFPPEIRKTEIDYYLTHLNTYGLPLDNRADYTKLDWEIWTATLTDSPTQFQSLVEPIYRWLNETPSRVPLTDWYDTKNGKQVGFQARSVVGGVFMKALANETLAKQWRSAPQ